MVTSKAVDDTLGVTMLEWEDSLQIGTTTIISYPDGTFRRWNEQTLPELELKIQSLEQRVGATELRHIRLKNKTDILFLSTFLLCVLLYVACKVVEKKE